jgi:hypothetical protein
MSRTRPVHEVEHPLLLGGPLAVLGEEDIRRKRRARAAVVEFEDQLRSLPCHVIKRSTPEGVVLLGENLAHAIRQAHAS